MDSTLLFRVEGPMQSWGTQSRFSHRDTGHEPSKSGIIGLVCAALGKPREERPGDGFPTLRQLTALTMGVRVDREGRVERDYHTAQKILKAGAKNPEKPGKSDIKGTGTLQSVLSRGRLVPCRVAWRDKPAGIYRCPIAQPRVATISWTPCVPSGQAACTSSLFEWRTLGSSPANGACHSAQTDSVGKAHDPQALHSRKTSLRVG